MGNQLTFSKTVWNSNNGKAANAVWSPRRWDSTLTHEVIKLTGEETLHWGGIVFACPFCPPSVTCSDYPQGPLYMSWRRPQPEAEDWWHHFSKTPVFLEELQQQRWTTKEKKKAKWLTRLRMHDEWSDGSFDCRRACGGKNAGAGNLVRTGASCQLHCCNFTLLCNRPTVPLGTTTFRRHGIGELVPSEVMPGFRCVGRLTQVHVSAS